MLATALVYKHKYIYVYIDHLSLGHCIKIIYISFGCAVPLSSSPTPDAGPLSCFPDRSTLRSPLKSNLAPKYVHA